ncbi:MAG: glycosyltransferase [Vicinamibacterales bacterium]
MVTAPPGGAPVRVLHIVHALRFGGMEFGVVKLANALGPFGVSTTIVSCTSVDDVRTRVSPDVAIHALGKREGNDPGFVVRLARLLRRERPDVVHTHGWGTLVEGLLAARLARVAVVVHGEHGTLQDAWRQRVVQRWCWSRVDRLLAVSGSLADRMASGIGVPRDRIFVIRNGVELDRFSARTREDGRTALGLAADEYVIGTVGRLVPVKDQENLLRAFAEVARRVASARLVVVGDGPLRADLEGQARALGLNERVQWLGSRLDVELLLKGFDVFVLSSKSEGMSNTMLEAMASGVPVVATDVGGARELVVPGETGVLVPACDAGALAEPLTALASDPARRLALGEAGRLRAERHFGLATMLKAYASLYRELSGRPALTT